MPYAFVSYVYLDDECFVSGFWLCMNCLVLVYPWDKGGGQLLLVLWVLGSVSIGV